jgi:hypothetical protein
MSAEGLAACGIVDANAPVVTLTLAGAGEPLLRLENGSPVPRPAWDCGLHPPW